MNKYKHINITNGEKLDINEIEKSNMEHYKFNMKWVMVFVGKDGTRFWDWRYV